MKTIKHIFILAAGLLLVNIPSNVYAFGNDWFEKKDNFFAYYDGMGSVNFSLLTWTWGASYNHYAYNDTASTKKNDRKRHTFVEYYISDTIVKFKNVNDNQWLKLFYYNGDNVINKKDLGMAWFYAPDNNYLFYSVSGKNYEKEKKLTNARDSVSIPHAKDDRKSVTFDLRWAVPTEMEGKYLSLRVHVSDNKDNGVLYDYTYNLIESVKMEKGTQAPELMDPMLFMGGDNPQDAGTILVPYVVMDELISIQTPLSPQPITGLSNMGSLEIQATDTVRYNFHITATVRKLNEDVISLKSNKVTIPAYHKIQSFTVTPKMDTIKDETNKKQFALVNSGYKLLTWTVNNENDSDAMSMDYFEVERAYKADFSDAEQLEPVAYETGKKTYEFVDDNTINNPYGSDSIYYRIRRMSAASFGWKGHPYTRSYTYVGRVKQIGMNLCTDLLQTKPYAAFSDCATDSVTDNNKIDLSARFVWPIADSAAVTAWDPLTRIEVVLWEDQEEAQIVTIDTSEYHCRVFNQKLILEFSYTADLPKTCQEYDLSVRLNTDATRFDRPEKTEFWFYPKIRTQAVNMTSIKATNDDHAYPERTLIEWTADGEPDYFTVWRYKENSIAPSADVKDIEFDSIDIVDGRTNWYNDPDGVPGQPYIYMVKAVTLCTKRMESDAFAIGTRSRYGYIDGYVTYTNGNKVADVMVYLEKNNEKIDSVKTKANGYYKFSHIEYALDQYGSTYNIGVPSTNQTFRPAKGDDYAQVTLTPSIPAVHHVDFLSDDYRRCSGRVLYTGTTIPVRDAYFLISGQVAMNNNDTIRTDASGNFTLSVPSGINFFLTVVKDKHTFMNDGKLMIGGKDTLNFQSGSLDGVKFWDNTRVRLVGRLSGGDVQGLKPLGFGLSKNNLGDSLKLILELEGDNIAHFVYDEKDLTKTTRDTAFVRTMGKDTTLLTPVRFEQKRVIVRPDPATGEYMIDLPPVKYRIVEASANGYATLFSAGRTAETKDLTNSLDTLQCTYDGRTTWYHDTYSVIYHAPASVRVAQLHYGMPIDFYGEEAVKGYTLNATRIDSVYKYNPKSKRREYVFGYPVYLSGLLYNFRIYACEEYHYNNDINRPMDVVSLGGHQFTVYNGLLSGTSVIKGQLNNEGYCNVTVDVANVSYDAIGDAALKHLDVSVNVNGQDVHAQPIQAFVLGGRITGSDAMTSAAMTNIGSVITVDDVLRDPPGSNSYAWIEKGATYNSSCSLNNGFDVSLDVSTTQGTSKTDVSGTHGLVNVIPNPLKPEELMPLNTAAFDGTVSTSSSVKTWPIFSYSQSFSWNQTYNYSYTTTERIQTGSSNNIMGADATIFIGHTINAYAMHSEVFTTVDAATLSKMKPSVASGMTKIIAQKDSTSPALIVTKDVAFTLDPTPVQFVYTQDHIVNQVIPQLAAELSSLIRTGDRQSLQGIADSTKKVVYWWNEAQDTIIMLKPNSWKPDTIVSNEALSYINLINQWVDILYDNERKEVYGTMPMLRVGSYSVSANTTVTHSEAGSAGYNYSFTRNETPDLSALKGLPDYFRINRNKAFSYGEEHYLDGMWGSKWKLNIIPNADFRGTQTSGNNQTQNRNIGFTLSQAEYGYIDVDVYSLAGTVDSTFSNWRDKATTFLTRDSLNTGNYDCSDFIYVLRGGATRCPYIGENKTQFFRPGTMLDPATVKLDEAHMEVDKHEVSGVAADGVAVFDLQIWNESEAAPGVANGPHNFTLKLLEGTNPNGAKASIDGLTLTGAGRNFYLSPGQVIHKKLEVRRGALALDYDSLKLSLISDCDTSNYADQYISVHFLPASTPVRIATPDDKWVMNTNSPYDKQGYYLPVVIDGFDTEYANFDHIELQYKLSTQSESNWVTLCSYYVDSVYYKKANGNKQMFNKEAGRIDNIHFYGERDPMEQRYDLRAVSYCRYGTDYVTTASEPVSGIKDTRRPRLFGNIAPANGVLTKQDYIYVPFSEPIAYNYLDEDNNFQVVGFKNKADYFSMPTLTFSGNAESFARTQTTRNLIGDYSIDLTVYQENTSGKVAYFSFGKNIEFGRKDSLLYARIGETEVLASRGGLPTGGFARVVMTYNAATDIVRFYIGTQSVGEGAAHAATAPTFTIVEAAPFVFGVGVKDPNPFKGRMTEARIWSKTLTESDIFATNNTCLSGYENGLLAYYPMTEGSGNIAYDKAHGADATINNPTWSMPEGKALKVNNAKGVQMDAQWFNNSADADYTLLFSFKSDPAQPFSSDEGALLFGDINAKMDKTNKQIGIFMTQSGQIVLASDSVNRLVAEGNYKDGAWHTLGLVVGRSFNYTHLYIDGQLKAQANGQFFGAWAMSQTILGRNFNGYFDELSMWEFAMPQDYLSEFDTYAPNGQEMGLRCYLPFDQRILNDNSVYETHYSPYNARLYYNSDKQEWYAKQDTVIRSQLDDKSTTTDVCPLIRNSEYEKIRFDWVGNNNELIINLNVPDMEINHKNVFFSLRDVEDLQGNRLLNPIAWSVYVDRNVIRWDEQNLWIIKSAGPMDTVVYTTITNHSGENKPFVISGLPDWLTVDEPVGTLKPQEERVLAFTVSGDLNAGDYVVPVSLTDETGMSDQMLVNVRIEAVFPNWSVPNDLNQNMNLIGTVHLRDEAHGTYVDTDTRDIVGAFYGNTCVGMQSITSKVGSTANLYIKVYGNTEMKKKDISLRLWQASTGKTYILQPEKEVICFVPDTVYGSIQKPVQLYVADLRVQNIPVYKGWNWISFYVQPDSLKSSFITTGGFSSDDLIKTYRAQNNTSSYTGTNWTNNIALDNSNIYMLHVNRDMVVEVRGTAADKVPELTFRHGWNNLPCLFEANTPLDAAMADYFNAAKDGDIITGYYQFAVFDNKQWVGSLETLIPGEGYMLYRQAKDNVTVHFNPVAPASAPRRGVIVDNTIQTDNREYSTAMPIVAALESDEVAINLDNAVLRAYAHDKLVGEAQAVDGMWFLLVHAAEGSELTFTVTDDQGEEQQASNVLNYGAFAPTGTVSNPYLIRFGESDLRKVINHGILYIYRNGNTYNAQGAKL